MALSLFHDSGLFSPFLWDASPSWRVLERQLLDPSFERVANWQPKVDISETEQEYKISAEVPGAKKEDVKVELKGSTVSITGKVEQEKKEEGETFHRFERSFGSFSRSFVLPSDANKDNITADFANGILKVNVPKKPKVDKEIPVQQVEVKSSL